MRKIIAIILAFVVCFCSVCVYADTNEKFTIRVVSKEVKVGETVELNINMENNTGILAMLFVLNYDSKCLKLIDVKNGTIVEGAFFGNDYNQIPYKMLWNSASDTNFTDNGVLATLVFEVLANAPDGTTDVTLTHKEKNVYDVDLNSVDISVENGAITIVNEENIVDNNENTSDKENNNDVSSSTDKPNANAGVSSGTSSGGSIRPNKKEDKTQSSSIVSLPDEPQISAEEDYKSAELDTNDVLDFEDEIAKSDILLLQQEVPVEVNETAIRVAEKYDVKVILNSAPIREISDELAEKVFAVTPNEQ